MRAALLVLALALAEAAGAEAIVAARAIRAQTVLSATDVLISETGHPGALRRLADVVGMETRVFLYPGRPIFPADIAPAALIERNQIVELIWLRGTLRIATEARALDRAGVGDTIRVMNMASRTAVTGVVMEDGTVWAARGAN